MQTRDVEAEAQVPRGARQTIGFVTSVRGSDVMIELPPSDIRATVGRYVRIAAGSSQLIGTLTNLTARDRLIEGRRVGSATAELALVGEIVPAPGGVKFRRGVSEYPVIGDHVDLIDSSELALVFRSSGEKTIEIGRLQQDSTVPATIKVNELLNKHFAVLGTTGVGKSSGVAILLDAIMQARPDLRIFLLDGHNEYGRCFGDRAQVVSPRTLKLPFWLFNFEEFVDVIYGGRPPVAEEIEALAELIPIAKSTYGQYKAAERSSLRRNDPKATGFTVDTPVPYLLQDLLGLIDERMGRLDNRSSRMIYHRLMGRIEMIRNDSRYGFMFQNANVGGDTMADLLAQLFRLEPDGKPMCVMQLAGLPAEVTDAVVSVLCRLAFDFGLWSEGAMPMLFLCEEAHRYASADHAIGFHPTRRALARIAKEGRKYGVFLGLVTQRPAELDPTIISQCSTIFALRMANDRDQALLRSAISDDAANLLSFVPSLGEREVIGFGEGVNLPTRMVFKTLSPSRVPNSEALDARHTAFEHGGEREFIRAVVDRWRGAVLGTKPKAEDPEPEAPAIAPPQPKPAPSIVDPARYRLLKRPLDVADSHEPLGQARFQR